MYDRKLSVLGSGPCFEDVAQEIGFEGMWSFEVLGVKGASGQEMETETRRVTGRRLLPLGCSSCFGYFCLPAGDRSG